MVGFELQIRAGGRRGASASRASASRSPSSGASAEEEQRTQDARQDEARQSIARIEADQREADDELNRAQRRLFDAREAMQAQANRDGRSQGGARGARRARRARWRSKFAGSKRPAPSSRRGSPTRREDLATQRGVRRTELQEGVGMSESRLDAGVRTFDEQRDASARRRSARSRCAPGSTSRTARIREARRALEGVRAEASRLEVARATAEADLAHLAASCVEAVQATLDEVAAEVEALEREGLLASPKPIDDRPDAAEIDEDAPRRRPARMPAAAVRPPARRAHDDARRDGRRPARPRSSAWAPST